MTNITLDRLSEWLENKGFSDQYSIEIFKDSLEIDPPFFYLVKRDRSIDQISLGSDYDLAIAQLAEFFGV